MWEEVGWQGVTALMQAGENIKYKHCTSIRLWRTKCEDEGIRNIAKFMLIAKSVIVLELLDANISPVGCEILGDMLH